MENLKMMGTPAVLLCFLLTDVNTMVIYLVQSFIHSISIIHYYVTCAHNNKTGVYLHSIHFGVYERFYFHLIQKLKINKIYSIRSCKEVTATPAPMVFSTQLPTLQMRTVSELKVPIFQLLLRLLLVKHLVLDLNRSVFLLFKLPVFQKER